MYTLPKDDRLRLLWIRFIRTKRADYQPHKDHALCEHHFTQDSLMDEVVNMRRMGMKRKGELKPGSVPTIHAMKDTLSLSSADGCIASDTIQEPGRFDHGVTSASGTGDTLYSSGTDQPSQTRWLPKPESNSETPRRRAFDKREVNRVSYDYILLIRRALVPLIS